MNKIKISIYAITGDEFCVAAEDGEKVFEQLKKAIQEERQVEISFLNVEMLTAAFLNTAIGKLYGEFDEEKIKDKLTVSEICNADKLLLKRVVDTAKAYYKNPGQFEESISKVIDNQL